MEKGMDKEFVTYQQAVELKELGFNEDCMARWAIDYPLKDFDTGAIVQRINKITIPHPIVSESDVDLENKLSKDRQYYALAPFKQQVFRWFREKYGWIGGIRQLSSSGSSMIIGEFRKDDDNNFILFRDIYEEVENACIDELIEIAKQQN